MLRDDRPSPTLSAPILSSPTTTSSAADRFAAWALRRPLATALIALAVAQVATWIPHYLTWPFWADHDVFATAARAWEAGRLPYRETRGNNFPGTIYLFWILGKAAGWGRAWPFYAFDASLLLTLGGLLLAWSRRRLGGGLPGIVGYLAFLGYYLGLSYCQAAQRDWQGPFFAIAGVLVAQTWPGRGSRLVSALAMAVALTIRPQAILLLPALMLALTDGRRDERRALIGAVGEWALAFVAFLALGFAPLIWAGVGADFLRSVRLVAYGGRYNQVTISSFPWDLIAQFEPFRMLAVPASILLLGREIGPAERRLASSWLTAMAGVALYKPLSPIAHSYLDHPLVLVWSINLSVLVHRIVTAPRAAPRLRLVGVLLVLGLGARARPELCALGPTRHAPKDLRRGDEPRLVPPGYRPGRVATAAFYPWKDYREVLHYLRHETTPETRVANVLLGDPALTGPANRLSAFPAESITWLRMVRPDDEDAFAEALIGEPRSVVVWSPGEVGPDPKFALRRLPGVIRDYYEPSARFGRIEVWRRKGANLD